MSRLAVAIIVVLVAGVLATAMLPQYVSGDIATEVGLSTWWWRVKVHVYVYANLINAYKIIGTNPWVSLFIDYRSQMNPDFSDVRFVYNGNYMGTYWRFVSSSTAAIVYVQLPSDSKAVVTPYTFYMYYGNPNAKMWGQSNVPAIGFVWRDWQDWYEYDMLETKGVNLPYTAGWGMMALWIRADSGNTYYRLSLGKRGGPAFLKLCLLRGIWDINYVDATAKDFYSYIYDVYNVACYDPTNVDYVDLAIPERGWYTVLFRWAAGAFGFTDIMDLSTNNMFGNAVDVVPMSGDKYRYWLVPVLWNSNYYSYSFGDPERVAAAVAAVPTVVWNATLGGSYYEVGYMPRTVTVTVPFFTTVTTSIPVVLPPNTTVTTTVYMPITTITTWIPIEPTTITKTFTVTVPSFTYREYTTTVTMPVKSPYTVTSTITTTASYTTVVDTITTVTTITSTLVTSSTKYTTVTVTSPWRITQVSPYTTVTSTITTTIPVTTTIYETATVPVYYTETLTLSNTNTATVTTTVPLTAAVNGAEATYIYNNPVVIGPEAGPEAITTTAYWVVRSVETTTVTTTVGAAAAGVSWLGWVVLLVMLAVMGFAIFYLVKRSRL